MRSETNEEEWLRLLKLSGTRDGLPEAVFPRKKTGRKDDALSSLKDKTLYFSLWRGKTTAVLSYKGNNEY